MSASANSFRLDGKTAVVTGGGSGIGRAIALKFAANGASLHILDVNLQDAQSVADEIHKSGGQASAIACDVSNQAQTVEVFQNLFAGARVDILVNNAGISQIGNVESTSESDFDRILRVNVRDTTIAYTPALGT